MSKVNKEDARRAAFGRIGVLIEHYGGKVNGRRATCPMHGGDDFNVQLHDLGGTCFSHCEGFDAIMLVQKCERIGFSEACARVVEMLEGCPEPTPAEAHPERNVPQLWGRMARGDEESEAYLLKRGIALRDSDLLRYSVGATLDRWVDARSRDGYRVAVPMRDLSGAVRDLAIRCVRQPEDPRKKVLVLPGVKTAGLAMSRPLPAQYDEVIITEGLTDTLAASLLWPDAAALGVPGALLAESVVRAFATIIRGRRLIIATDTDFEGERAASAAIAAGWDAGAAEVVRRIPDAKDITEELAGVRQ